MTHATQRRYKTPEEALAARTEVQGDCLVWTGAKLKAGYGSIQVNGKRLRVHRYAWERERGAIPDGVFVDHLCHNRLCVALPHLRLATPAENLRNLSGPQANNALGVRNVRLSRGQYRVEVMKDGVRYVEKYESLADAGRAAEALRQKLFGEFAGKG